MYNLKPCPFCKGDLDIYIHDDTFSKFCNGYPCWDGGATCEQCGIGISAGSFGSGLSINQIEEYIIETLNRRPE